MSKSKKNTKTTSKSSKKSKAANVSPKSNVEITLKFQSDSPDVMLRKAKRNANSRNGLLPHEQATDASAAPFMPSTPTEAEPTLDAATAAPVAPCGDADAALANDTTPPAGADTGEPVATGGNPPSLDTSFGGQRRMGILSAAVRILEEHDGQEPLNCQQMLEQITAKGYWAPKRGGKTPASTLYAAILMEIRKKGEASRFEKVARGRFILKNHS